MSQTAAADDSAWPPLTKAVSMTNNYKGLLHTAETNGALPILFQRTSPAKKYSTSLSRNHLAFDLAVACKL